MICFAPVVVPIPRKGWFWFLKPQRYRVLEGHHRVAAYTGKLIHCIVCGEPQPKWIKKSRLGG